jgi:hypothetical protein
VSQLVNFLTADANGTHTRVAYFGGNGFVQSEYQTGGVFTNHADLLNNKLGANIKIYGGNPAYSYQPATGNFANYVDLTTAGPLAGDIYSVGNACTFGNDVLVTSGTGVASGFYSGHVQGFPSEQPISGVYNNPGAGNPWFSYVDGWDIRNLYSRYGGSSIGRLGYYYRLLTQLQGQAGCTIVGTPLVTLDVPGTGGAKQYVDFMSIRNNPLVSGSATVHFGLARGDRVQVRVYDVTGRLVRTLADRNFTAGEHDLVWDGSDNAGVQMARGVYFTQVRYMNSHFTDARKLTVLK